jgi:hypothetical protein
VSTATDRLDALIDEYIGGKRRFMGFWRAFMESWADATLTRSEEEAYADAYDTVYMGAEGPVAARDGVVGLLDEPEIKRRLTEFRRRQNGAAPA